MKFRTELIPHPKIDINPLDKSVFLGSCFGQNIGSHFSDLGLPAVYNPFGIIFHPVPIFEILCNALTEDFNFKEAHLLHKEGVFYSLKHSSRFKGDDSSQLVLELNRILTEFRNHLKESKVIFISLGTAWGYYHHNEVVGNCHKLPQALFEKRLSDIKEIAKSANRIHSVLDKELPDTKVIYTVSPVRHIKDGLVNNSRSKASLIQLVHKLSDSYKSAFYFPSYELLIDDLRDYRYFKEDLIHPTDMAVRYVLDYLEKTFFSSSLSLLKELNSFKKLRDHRVLSQSEKDLTSHNRLVQIKMEELKAKYPEITL